MMYHSFLPTQTSYVTTGTLCRRKTVDSIFVTEYRCVFAFVGTVIS